MGFSFGPGFDSPQLHDQAEFKHPRQGVFAFEGADESLLSGGFRKRRNRMRSIVFEFYLQYGSKGTVSEANTPRSKIYPRIMTRPVGGLPSVK